jgi:hypothetical protein
MNWDAVGTLLPSVVAIVAVWVNLQNEVGKLKTRLSYLEGDQNELKELLKTVNEAVQEIRLIIAKNQL